MKSAWKSLYSDVYKGNVGLIVQFLIKELNISSSANVDKKLTRTINSLLGIKSYQESVSLNKVICLFDLINIFDIATVANNDLELKFIQKFLGSDK